MYIRSYATPHVEKRVISAEYMSVGPRAFKRSQVKEVRLEGAVRICREAFLQSSIETIDMQHVTAIENSAFEGCKWLKKIIAQNVEFVGLSAFEDCTSLKSVHMPAVRSVFYNAFQNCLALTSVVMDIVRTIQPQAFEGCVSLESVYAPQVEDIAINAFGCTNLRSVYFPKCTRFLSEVFSDCRFETFTHDGIERLDDGVFFHNEHLKEVHFENLKILGQPTDGRIGGTTLYTGTFQYCHALETVHIPNVERIYKFVFKGCPSLKTIILPKTLTWIHPSAFYRSLAEVVVPEYCEGASSIIYDYENVRFSGKIYMASLEQYEAAEKLKNIQPILEMIVLLQVTVKDSHAPNPCDNRNKSVMFLVLDQYKLALNPFLPYLHLFQGRMAQLMLGDTYKYVEKYIENRLR
tara:strand:- start:898 stop:2118 length:1221 start_codon:yes stop_codon:yes gene_type:complete